MSRRQPGNKCGGTVRAENDTLGVRVDQVNAPIGALLHQEGATVGRAVPTARVGDKDKRVLNGDGRHRYTFVVNDVIDWI